MATIDPSKKPGWVRVLPELPANFRFKNTSKTADPSRRGVPPKLSPRKPSQPAQVEMSLGQQPICDSECMNCQKEPEVQPSRGEKPPVPPKPARLTVQPQAAFGGPDYNRELGEPLKVKKVPPPVAPKPSRFRQPEPPPGNILLPPVPSQPGMLRPSFPSQPGMLRPPFPSQPGTMRPSIPLQPGMQRPPIPPQPGMQRPPFSSQPGMLRPPFPTQPGMLRPPIPSQPGMQRPPIPSQPEMQRPPFPSQPLTLRPPIPPQPRMLGPSIPQQDVISQSSPNRPFPFSPPNSPRPGAQPRPVPVQPGSFSENFSPHTPPREDEQYTEYMRSREPSQGDGEMSFMESAAVGPGRGRYHSTLEPMTPATDQYTKYCRRLVLASTPPELRYMYPVQPKQRTRLYGTSDSIRLQDPHLHTGPFFPDTPTEEKEYNELHKQYTEYLRTHPPFSPHTPPRADEQYTEYMRSREPSQGDGEMSFVEPAAVKPKRQKKAYGYASRRVIAIPPPIRIDSDIAPFSPHTPPREDEVYTEYMRSRRPSRDDEMTFVEPAAVPPISRKRGYAMSDSSGTKPLIAPRGDRSVFGTNKIHNVTSDNFDEVMKSMEKAFVMFYDPKSESSICAGKEFAKAAEKKYPAKHAFAVVDCTQEKDLCAREDAIRLPMFRLYSNGFDLSTIRHVRQFCAKQIHTLMTMTPVLTQPRMNVVPGSQRR